MKKLFLLAFLIPSISYAQGKYDGNWQIIIQTTKGQCDRVAYAYVDVTGSAVHIRGWDGGRSHSAAGLVSDRGMINATVRGIAARGRLTGHGGSGRWVSPEKACSGVWTANNRG